MDSFSHIRWFLAQVRRHLRRFAAARVALYGTAGAALLALILPLAALLFAAHRGGVLAVVGLCCGALLVAGSVFLGAIGPRRRWRHDRAVAGFVGARQPAIASDLLSSVELGQIGPAGIAADRHVSVELVGALIDRTAAQTRDVAPHSLIDRRPLRRAAAVCAGAVVLHLAVLAVAATPLGRGWQRLLHPADPRPFGDARVSQEPLVGDIRITLDYPAYSGLIRHVLPSSSGDFRALPGTVVTLETRALVPVRAARLVFETTSDPDDDRPGAPRAVAPADAPGPSEAPGPGGQAGPPAPAELPAAERATDRATDRAADRAADRPTDRATSDPVATRRDVPLQVAADGSSLVVRFTVTEAARYRFLLETPGGESRVEALTRQIELEVDHAPHVELYTPGDEIDVTSLKRIELAYIAEDDYGIAKVELVWDDRGKLTRKALPAAEGPRRTAQGKFLWDLAEVALEPGVAVAYHFEVTDNDTVRGPNVGRSRSFRLRVFSPREKHEQLIARQRELAEKMIRALGGRLIVPSGDMRAHDELHRITAELVVELGTLITAFKGDELGDDDLRQELEAMRTRLDKLDKAEAALLSRQAARQQRGAGSRQAAKNLASHDAAMVGELEDDVILLANWLDRQQMENLLAISDEIKQHQDRLRELFKEYERTGSPDLLAEIEREMRFLQKRLAEMAHKRVGLPDDVLDRFVNAEAMQSDRAVDCMAQVRDLLARGDPTAAQRKLDQCMQTLDSAAEAMERALSDLRSDTFSEAERKYGELLDRIADLAQDQRELARSAADVWERYADRAAEMMREEAKETRKRVGTTLEALREQLGKVPRDGLTPFAAEELEITEARLADVDRMLADGDIAEALAMARQAQTGIDTMSAELEAALEDEHGEPWTKRTEDARRELRRARPLARRLVDELEASTPSPRDIMSREDRRLLDRLRRRQRSIAERTRRLMERSREMAGDLPGRSGEAMAGGLEDSQPFMSRARERMQARDPSGSRQETRGAAEALERTLQSARDAARRRQSAGRAGLRDETVRIPGADEYRAPAEFREDILEAMKREKAPPGFGDLVKRYYEDLIR